MGMFQMLVLAKGQRNLLRVPGGVGDGVGRVVCRGADDAAGVDVDAGVEVGVTCGVPVADSAAGELWPSVEPGEFPTVGVGATAMCACA
jgi:hypothetical protein